VTCHERIEECMLVLSHTREFQVRTPVPRRNMNFRSGLTEQIQPRYHECIEKCTRFLSHSLNPSLDSHDGLV